MAYISTKKDVYGDVKVVNADYQLDSFGRLKVSTPFTLFSAKQDLASQDYLFNTVVATGGTSTYSANRASTSLAVTTSSGSSAIRQSRAYIPYQPGKSTSFVATAVIGAGQTNTVKRIGMFDANNGVFFQLTGSTKQIVQRSFVSGSAVDTVVASTSWNIDTFDGSGNTANPSGIAIDWTKTNLFIIDFQWLGAGRVRYGFIVNGSLFYCHQVTNANNLTSVFMSTPNLPVRFEIFNSGSAAGASTLEAICCEVNNDAGFDAVGYNFSAFNYTGTNIGSANLLPVIILRPKATHPRPVFQITDLSLISTSTVPVFWGIYINPTLGAGTGPTYNAVHANSQLEFDVASTQIITGGTLIQSGFFPGGGNKGSGSSGALGNNSLSLLSADLPGTTVDILVIAMRQVSGGANSCYGSVNMLEYS